MKDYLDKAREQFKAGVLLYMNGYNNDAISRLYYAFRSLAVFLLGKPERGKWKHFALMKKFMMKVDEIKILPLSREERKLIKDFASVREEADYELIDVPNEVVKSYIKLVERFLKEIGNVKGSNKD